MHNPAFAASVKAQLGADLAVHVEEECVSNATLFLEVGNTVTADTDKGVAPALVVEDCPDILWKLAKDVFEVHSLRQDAPNLASLVSLRMSCVE